uniref:Uncharacterized protein n=1 Tax=Romanomermis culicivorax TaxID=13658 RepID=A0A915JJX7_ROMCU
MMIRVLHHKFSRRKNT